MGYGRIECSATRRIGRPLDVVLAVATDPGNLHWMKGWGQPVVVKGDGRAAGSRFRLTPSFDFEGRVYEFEVTECDEGSFAFRAAQDVLILEGMLTVVPIDGSSCDATWWSLHRPDHWIERMIVTFGRPWARRAGRKDAGEELRRFEQVVEWVVGGRNGPPFTLPSIERFMTSGPDDEGRRR